MRTSLIFAGRVLGLAGVVACKDATLPEPAGAAVTFTVPSASSCIPIGSSNPRSARLMFVKAANSGSDTAVVNRFAFRLPAPSQTNKMWYYLPGVADSAGNSLPTVAEASDDSTAVVELTGKVLPPGASFTFSVRGRSSGYNGTVSLELWREVMSASGVHGRKATTAFDGSAGVSMTIASSCP